MMEWIRRINDALNGFVWGPVVLTLLVCIGLWLSFATGFFQFRRFRNILKGTLGRIFAPKSETGTSITPFQALTTALAGSVGTGNIAGVAGAILLGGPGAVFWMWVSALFGMMTKFAEVFLAIRFRRKNSLGEWVGGPMYYIEGGLGRRARPLACAFALFGVLASFGMGNMAQVNTLVTSALGALNTLTKIDTVKNEQMIRLIAGGFVALLTGLVIIGGVKRIGSVTERVIPLMSVLYLTVTMAVVLANCKHIPGVLKEILSGAFGGFRPMMGGIAGFTISAAMRQGISRGVFSNEAGLGSSSIAHACADAKSPVDQAYYGVMEVFVDTIVLCTLTALALLCSGIRLPYGDANAAGAVLTQNAIATVFGSGFSAAFLAVAIFFFALSTLIGWSLYGVRCVEYLFGSRAVLPYRVLFVLAVLPGATMELSLIWGIADTFNGMMAIPNLIALIALSGTVIRAVGEHDRSIALMNGYRFFPHKRV